MRITVAIDPALVNDVVKAAGAKTKSKTNNKLTEDSMRKIKAVDKVLKEYLRKVTIAELRAMAGKIAGVDNWRELEELELTDQRKLQW